MSYRRAWTLVREIPVDDTAGETLVELTTGGSGGGGASLRPRPRSDPLLPEPGETTRANRR